MDVVEFDGDVVVGAVLPLGGPGRAGGVTLGGGGGEELVELLEFFDRRTVVGGAQKRGKSEREAGNERAEGARAKRHAH